MGDRAGIAEIVALLGGAKQLRIAILLVPDSPSRSDAKLLRAFAHSTAIPESLSAAEIAGRIA